MATQNSAYVKRLMQFSLKDPKGENLSLIRVRMTINGTRLNQPLPADYKILPKHWDYENCCAIEDPKHDPDLKGNAHLQMRMRNINKEIEKTRDAVIRVHESFSILNTEKRPVDFLESGNIAHIETAILSRRFERMPQYRASANVHVDWLG